VNRIWTRDFGIMESLNKPATSRR